MPLIRVSLSLRRGTDDAVQSSNDCLITGRRGSMRERGESENLGRPGGEIRGIPSRGGTKNGDAGTVKKAEPVDVLMSARPPRSCCAELVASSWPTAQELPTPRSQAGGAKKGGISGRDICSPSRALFSGEKG